MLQIDRLLLRRDRLFDRDGTLAELTFHTDWMRYDCYVDLSGAVLGYLTEPMPVPELDGFTPAAFRSSAPEVRTFPRLGSTFCAARSP